MSLTPPGAARPRSTDSSDLPIDCKDAEGDDEEKRKKRRSAEDKNSCCCDLLRDQQKQFAARAIAAEKLAEELNAQTLEWMEFTNKHELEILKMEDEMRKQKEYEESLLNKQKELYAKYDNALESSAANGLKAIENLDEVNKLRQELEQAAKDLSMERLTLSRKEEELAEASNIISGLLGKSDFKEKVDHKKPLNPAENMALRWRYPALEREKEQLEKDMDEKKKAIGRLEFERDQLQLDLKRARSAPGSELSAEMVQKISELEKANAQLRDELAKAAQESKESQLLVNKLTMDNQDLTDRLRKMEERPRENSHGDKDYRTHSTSNQGRRSLSKEEMSQKMKEMEAATAEVRREMARTIQQQKEKLEESVEIIEKKIAENDDLLDRNKKLADRLERYCATPPARDGHREESRREKEESRKDHSRHSRGEDRREDRGKREEGSSELREAVRRLEAEVREEKKNAGLLEADRNDLRALLKRTRNEKTREQEEKEHELKTDIELKGTRIIHLECTLKDVQDRLAKEMKEKIDKTKGITELEQRVAELEIEVEGLKNSLANSQKERRRLEGEVEEQKKINVVLVTTKSGELMEELTAARKRIKDLESELQQGCSSAKRARLEELKKKIDEADKPGEPTPPPPFTLQAVAPAAPTTAPAPQAKWKSAFPSSNQGSKTMNKHFKNF